MRDERYDSGVLTGIAIALIGVVILVFAATSSRAEWDGPSTPELQEWFRRQTNALGQVCCDGTEVARVDDYQWSGGRFVARVNGVDYRVAPEKVSPAANRAGVALAWFYPRTAERSEETLRCFMRGQEG